mmetsp:Transcript_34184/g.54954  ORF Transcript_34184/g.54954 Transcript_34184/m.54954 type:complete len:191 (-) Transcript_34184:268-840(-)
MGIEYPRQANIPMKQIKEPMDKAQRNVWTQERDFSFSSSPLAASKSISSITVCNITYTEALKKPMKANGICIPKYPLSLSILGSPTLNAVAPKRHTLHVNAKPKAVELRFWAHDNELEIRKLLRGCIEADDSVLRIQIRTIRKRIIAQSIIASTAKLRPIAPMQCANPVSSALLMKKSPGHTLPDAIAIG